MPINFKWFQKSVAVIILLGASVIVQFYFGALKPEADAKGQLLIQLPRANGVSASGKAFPRALTVDLSSDTNPPIKLGQFFTLTLFVSNPFDVNNVEIEWILPKGISLISGQKTLTVNLLGNQPVQISATFVSADNENHVLIARSSFGRTMASGKETRHGGIAHFVTNPAPQRIVASETDSQSQWEPSSRADSRTDLPADSRSSSGAGLPRDSRSGANNAPTRYRLSQ
jgi:hypothetical protein